MDECKPLLHGVNRHQQRGERLHRRDTGADGRGQRGRAVQVAGIKPTWKAPGIKLLKLKHDAALSDFTFKFNLRRYSVEQVDLAGAGFQLAIMFGSIFIGGYVDKSKKYKAGTPQFSRVPQMAVANS